MPTPVLLSVQSRLGTGTETQGRLPIFLKSRRCFADGLINADNKGDAMKSCLRSHKHNIKVMNISPGRPVYESAALDPLCQAVEAAWKAGIVVVVAAGNGGRDNSWAPKATPPSPRWETPHT
jgi:subtilisin family serine protease